MKKLLLYLMTFAIVITVQSQSWTINGNSNINPAIHFLGTTNNQPLKFRINNQYAGEIDSVLFKTFFGYGAGKNTTGGGNTGIGFKALNANTTGLFNTAMGSNSLSANTSGYQNCANGAFSLSNNTTGSANTASGYLSLRTNTTGLNNTAFGHTALTYNINGNGNTAIGSEALSTNSTGSNNTAIGFYSLGSNTTASYNTAIGSEALHVNTTGTNNAATGAGALYSNATGSYNTANGAYSLHNNTTGSDNTAIGYNALYSGASTTGNTAVGYVTLGNLTTGNYNTAIGYGTLLYTSSGSFNIAVGENTMVFNTAGTHNTAYGNEALEYNTGGSYNVGIGDHANINSRNSQYNTALGYNAASKYDLGYNNTVLGANSDGSFAGQYNIIAIGQGVTCPDNSTARIGNLATWSIGGYAGWTNFSDGRYKKNVRENVKGLEFIMKLRPVTYNLDITGASNRAQENAGKEWDPKMKEAIADKEKAVFSGFVAQEVEQAAKETGYDFSGVDKPRNEYSFYGLRYADFVVPLVKAVQEQQQIINDLQKRISELERKDGNNLPLDNSNRLSVWPNPSNDNVIVSIVADNGSQASIKIFDSKGALVKQQQTTILQGNNQIKINMTGLAGGTYLFSAEWNNGQMKKNGQVIKQ